MAQLTTNLELIYCCFQSFGNTNNQGFLLVLSLVCKAWRKVALSPLLWSSVDLSSVEKAYQLFQRNINIYKREKGGKVFWTDDSVYALVKKYATTLERIAYTEDCGNNEICECFERLCADSITCPNLHEIVMTYCSKITYKKLITFIRTCCPKLNSLTLHDSGVGTDYGSDLETMLTVLPASMTKLELAVKTMHMFQMHLTDVSLLSKFTNLVHLTLEQVKIMSEPNLREMFAQLKQLQHLNLRNIWCSVSLREEEVDYIPLQLETLSLIHVTDNITAALTPYSPRLRDFTYCNAQTACTIDFLKNFAIGSPLLENVTIDSQFPTVPLNHYENISPIMKRLVVTSKVTTTLISTFQYLINLNTLILRMPVKYKNVITLLQSLPSLEELEIDGLEHSSNHALYANDDADIEVGCFPNLKKLKIFQSSDSIGYYLLTGAVGLTTLAIHQYYQGYTGLPPPTFRFDFPVLTDIKLWGTVSTAVLVQILAAAPTVKILQLLRDHFAGADVEKLRKCKWPKSLKQIRGSGASIFKKNPQLLWGMDITIDCDEGNYNEDPEWDQYMLRARKKFD